MRSGRWLGLLLTGAAAPALAAITPADLELVRWPDASTTFDQPIAIRSAGDGSGRVFVIERCSGIRIVKNGVLLNAPFVSIDASCGGEQGILGLAFDPDYADNGTFYVSYTAPSGDPRLGSTPDHVLARYTVSAGDPDLADPAGQVILRVPDLASNHNGGDLHFDRDGYLNWSIGDGGPQNNPHGFAQCTGRKKADNDPSTCHQTGGSGPDYYLLGKIVRLDVHQTTAAAPANFCGARPGQPAPYAIPPGNPFRDAATFPQECAEIFNWGFRNPFRFSFDRQTGDLLVGDVGQNVYEEVSFQRAGSPGQDFQWSQCEGLHAFPGGTPGCNGASGSVKPKLDYSHAATNGCAVTGGYVYRGPIAPLRGQYLFGDYCSQKIYVVGDAGASVASWAFEILDTAPAIAAYSFGEDDAGNLYVANGNNGNIYRFHSDSSTDLIFRNGFDGS